MLSETNLMDNAVKTIAQRIDLSQLFNRNDIDATFRIHIHVRARAYV